MSLPIQLSKTALFALLACSSQAAPAQHASPRSVDPGDTGPGTPFDHQHTAWTKVLARFVHEDRFDYAGLKADRTAFDAYLASLHAVGPEELAARTREERFAFWINVYNAHTIQKVVDNYPLESIRDLDRAFGLKSVFDSEFVPMEAHHPDGKGDRLSLNDVEHKILRARFEDARVHAAINCASDSCPPLAAEAFQGDVLDEQLDRYMRAFVADRERNPLDRGGDRGGGTVRISEIFKWFSDDFERDAGSVREYLIRYAPEGDVELLRSAKLHYVDYSWELNELERPS